MYNLYIALCKCENWSKVFYAYSQMEELFNLFKRLQQQEKPKEEINKEIEKWIIKRKLVPCQSLSGWITINTTANVKIFPNSYTNIGELDQFLKKSKKDIFDYIEIISSDVDNCCGYEMFDNPNWNTTRNNLKQLSKQLVDCPEHVSVQLEKLIILFESPLKENANEQSKYKILVKC